MTKYEEYKLQWMIDHGISINDLINNIQHIWDMLQEEKEENEIISVATAYEVWHDSFGFNNKMWACKSEWEENEVLKPSSKDQLKIRVLNGTLVATPYVTPGPDYLGINIEYIDDNEPKNAFSRPRVLINTKTTERLEQRLRCLIWNDPFDDNYSEEIFLKTYDKNDRILEHLIAQIDENYDEAYLKQLRKVAKVKNIPWITTALEKLEENTVKDGKLTIRIEIGDASLENRYQLSNNGTLKWIDGKGKNRLPNNPMVSNAYTLFDFLRNTKKIDKACFDQILNMNGKNGLFCEFKPKKIQD